MKNNSGQILEIIIRRTETEKSVLELGRSGSRAEEREVSGTLLDGIPDEKRVSRLIHLEIQPLIEVIKPERKGKYDDNTERDTRPIFSKYRSISFHRVISDDTGILSYSLLNRNEKSHG
jgi:hypothetical protein